MPYHTAKALVRKGNIKIMRSILRRSTVTIRNIALRWRANKASKTPYFAQLAGAARRPIAASGHQPVERLAVLGGGFLQHVLRQARRRRSLVPGLGFQPVTHELLVERRRADACAVAVGRPEARRYGDRKSVV